MEAVNTGSAFATFFPLILLILPFVILNGIISERKGKNKLKYILLSLIPPLGIYLAIYLVSFLDKDVQDKINKIYEKIA
jgi:lipopolysaccharide export LptBFGC system permease protein LptF